MRASKVLLGRSVHWERGLELTVQEGEGQVRSGGRVGWGWCEVGTPALSFPLLFSPLDLERICYLPSLPPT